MAAFTPFQKFSALSRDLEDSRVEGDWVTTGHAPEKDMLMNATLRTSLLATALAIGCPAVAIAQGHMPRGNNANAIVGLWSVQVDVGPCAGGPRQQFRALNVYHAGGTLTATNAFAPTAQGPTLGVWSWSPQAKLYEARMQFYRYLPDGSFDGVQDIHRETTLSDDRNSFVDSIYVQVLNADETLRVELCGSSTATRVPIE